MVKWFKFKVFKNLFLKFTEKKKKKKKLAMRTYKNFEICLY